jgi:ferredoxin/flavodoxin
MRIYIVYFSGTGNTAWVVRRLTSALRQLGDEVMLASCEAVVASEVDPDAYDTIGIAFPIYSSFVPRVFRDFIQALPPAENKPLFAVVSAGYCAGDAGWYGVKPLQEKGYRPFLFGNVVVANNFFIPPMAIFPVTPPARLLAKLARAESKIVQLAGTIHRRENHFEGTGVWGRALGILQRLAGEGFETRYFGPFFADENCTQCGWCAKHCPVDNIDIKQDGPRFLGHCMLCMRCYSFCPTQAIQASAKTKDTTRFRRYSGPESKRYP